MFDLIASLGHLLVYPFFFVFTFCLDMAHFAWQFIMALAGSTVFWTITGMLFFASYLESSCR